MDREKLKEYFYSNIAIIFWTSFLLLGGGIFVAYYAYIEYMPDFDLKSSIAITAAASITAVFITAVLLMLMVLPGAVWGNTWGKESTLKNYWTDQEGHSKFRGLCLWFALPLTAVCGAVIAAAFVGWYALAIVVVFFSGYFLFVKFRSTLSTRVVGKEICGLIVATSIASMFIFFPLWLVINLYLSPHAALRVPAWVAGLLSVGSIIFVNVLGTSCPKKIKPFYWYLGLSFATLVMVLSLFQKTHRIPVRVMELYKFGNIQTTEMVLRKDACDTFAALNIEVEKKEGGLCVARDILILSRLGKEAYLQHRSDQRTLRFSIEASEIASWALEDVNVSKLAED